MGCTKNAVTLDTRDLNTLGFCLYLLNDYAAREDDLEKLGCGMQAATLIALEKLENLHGKICSEFWSASACAERPS